MNSMEQNTRVCCKIDVQEFQLRGKKEKELHKKLHRFLTDFHLPLFCTVFGFLIMTSRKKEKNEAQHVRPCRTKRLPYSFNSLVGHFNFRYMHAILFIRSVTPLYRFVLFVCLVVTMNTTWTCPISL